MATPTNVTLSIAEDVANAIVILDFDITWSLLDRETNLQYTETWRLIGDDTFQDGDDSANPGDDPIDIGLVAQSIVSANGQSSMHRTKTRTIPFGDLQEDTHAVPGVGDDEIRAVVELRPLLPVLSTRESNAVTVDV